MKYKILIVNDDSIHSEGLKVLADKVSKYASELMIVAPHTEQSATSHSIHIYKRLELHKHPDLIEGVPSYSLTGSPADCVKFALTALDYDFDIVFSGINNGYNLSDDICYSGTASGALEAEFYNKLGVAVSCVRGDLSGAKYLNEAVEYLFENDLFSKASIYNINIPNNSQGIKMTVQGKRRFNGKFIKMEDGTYQSVGAKYLNLDQSFIIREEETNADFVAIEAGYTSITPLTTDKTKR